MTKLPSAFARHLRPAGRPAQQQARPKPQPDPKKDVRDALRMANELHRKGDVTGAEKLCVSVLSRDPGNIKALLLGGTLALEVSDLPLAINLFSKATAYAPDSLDVRILLAETYEKMREFEDAIEHFQHAIAINARSAHALVGAGRVYTQSGKAEEALDMFARAAKLQPGNSALRLDRANTLISLGRMEEAAGLLQQNIKENKWLAVSYKMLADTRKFSEEPAELASITEILKQPGLPAQDRSHLHHAAGKIHNDLNHSEQALDHFTESKKALGYEFDFTKTRRLFDAQMSIFKPSLFEAKKEQGSSSEIPVFVVGMPRSGTTLTEQICSSHPLVHGAGEISKFNWILSLAGYSQSGTVQKNPQAMSASDSKAMATDYLDYLQNIAPHAARVINKTPHNFLYIGMIALLFPNAKIIHCTRDPIDNCLSCFFNTFNETHSYNSDLAALGLYYREYDRLMQHWNTVLPGKIHECNYETLIADQEAESRRLIEFLGLPWDDACLRFHENERTVTTPSRWQVRQPIYKTSVKRWQKYGDRIQPLIDALGDLAKVD